MPPDSMITPPMLADVVRMLPAVAVKPPADRYDPLAVKLPVVLIPAVVAVIPFAAKYDSTLAFEYVPSLPTRMLTPLAYVNALAETVVVFRLPVNTLPVTAAPPVTCRAPVPEPVDGVPETICRSCKLCGLVGLALLTVALV